MGIKIENIVLPSIEQWSAIIRGMRNPMNSWDKSDSDWFSVKDEEDLSNGYLKCDKENDLHYLLGHNDLDLMQRLRNAGPEHRKFMRMIPVYLDIIAPLYWWKEADTYKVGTVANSCSTMHKIHAKEFTLEDFSHDHLTLRSLKALGNTIEELNYWRVIFLDGYPAEMGSAEIPPKDKKVWWQIIQLLPSSYNQKRTVMLNYEVLTTIYHQRKHHKLDEWREFCKWIESLPYSELITRSKEED